MFITNLFKRKIPLYRQTTIVSNNLMFDRQFPENLKLWADGIIFGMFMVNV